MDILKAATEWAKAEVFSTSFFIIFGIVFVLASVGFWQLGKTDLARAYFIPTLVAGGMLLTIGLGLFFTNVSRVSSFAVAFEKDAPAFVEAEVERVDSTLKEYKNVVFKIIPLMIVAAALLIVFVDKPVWRAIAITSIVFLIVILLIDGTAHARIKEYKKQLEMVQQESK